MITIDAKFQSAAYPVYIGENLLHDHILLNEFIHGEQILIVTNTTVAKLYLEEFKNIFHRSQVESLVLPDGESYKNLDTLKIIFDALAKHNHHRDTTLIALGGGVIGDMTGFAAACYHRGVAFIQIPTTLLAQVDSSIGGKTAVNHPCGKNLIGAFYQPKAVIADISVLSTLPDREFRAGLAEIIKAALICDAHFFSWLEKHMSDVLSRKADALTTAITKAIEIKRNIVARDERENGERALLNLGHTFGHAIEHCLGYGTLLHGEAVAIGVSMAAALSKTLDWITDTEQARIDALLTQTGLPNHLPPEIKCDKLLAAMQGDKKIANKKLRLVLLKSIGDAVITDSIPDNMLINLITHHSDHGSD